VLTLLCLCFFCSLLSAKLKKSFFTRLFFCSLVQGTTLSRGLLLQQLECGKPLVGQQARPVLSPQIDSLFAEEDRPGMISPSGEMHSLERR